MESECTKAQDALEKISPSTARDGLTALAGFISGNVGKLMHEDAKSS